MKIEELKLALENYDRYFTMGSVHKIDNFITYSSDKDQFYQHTLINNMVHEIPEHHIIGVVEITRNQLDEAIAEYC